MTRFALIPSPFASHLRVFEALADRLSARGHHVEFVLNAGAGQSLAIPAGAHCVRAARRGSLEAIVSHAARPGGPFGILRTVADVSSLTDALCEDGPAILGTMRPDILIGDEMEPAAGLLAEYLGLPLVSVAAALPIDPAPGVPLPFLGWPFDPSPEGMKRNAGGVRIANLLLSRRRRAIARWSGRYGLPVRRTAEDCLSPSLRIAQIVPGLDYPRPPSPIFHAVGPIRIERPVLPVLPFAIDPRRPLVFASLGTLQGHRLGIFAKIAEACRMIGAQLLVAHCGGLNAAEAGALDADFVTDFVSLPAVMRRADLCVTHGGLNTVLDALQAGVPLLAIPIAFDQPGIAARIDHHGVGERLGRVTLSSDKIAACLSRLLASSSVKARAARIGREIASAGGAELAADLIERLAGIGGRVEPDLQLLDA